MKYAAIAGAILLSLGLALFVLVQASWVIIARGGEMVRVNKVTGQVQWLYDGRFMSAEEIQEARHQEQLQSCRELLTGKREPTRGYLSRVLGRSEGEIADQQEREECQRLLQSE